MGDGSRVNHKIAEHPIASACPIGPRMHQNQSALVRPFPIYAGEGAAAPPTGKTRQLHYELVPGKAGWLLRLDRTTDF
jgi:hypothetical protein